MTHLRGSWTLPAPHTNCGPAPPLGIPPKERKFGLSQVIIAQAPNGSEESIQDAVGAAAAHFLEITLRPRAVIGVASWSAPLLSMVEQMHPVWKLSECKVVQILGGEGHPSIEKHACYLVSQLARSGCRRKFSLLLEEKS